MTQQIHVSKVSVSPRSKRYNPDQPRVPAGQEGGGRWTDGGAAGGAIPLRDRVPRPMVNRAAVASMHKRWTPEQVDAYVAKLHQAHEEFDWSKIRYESDLTQRARASADRGRKMIRDLHDEVGGVKVASMGQASLNAFLGVEGGGVSGGGVLGAYNGRGIILGPSATAETYIHEYGHYLDYMLASARQRDTAAWSDHDEGLSAILGPDEPDWAKRELFAEWYSGWVRGKGTMDALEGDSDFWRRDRGKAVHQYLDAFMRQELRMKR